MNRINEFNLEPGVYAGQDGQLLVVIDVITEMFLINQSILDRLQDPYVVTRKLIESQLTHNRIAYPLSVFKLKFRKA
jgi:hypothetical protein